MKKKPKQKTDEELLKSYIGGQTASFRELLERYQRPLTNFLKMMVKDRHSAEDLFQDVFLSVHKSLGKFDLSKRFKPWLYAIASNLSKDELRRKKIFAKQILDEEFGDEGRFGDLLESTALNPAEILSKVEQLQTVRDILESLPLQQREVLALYYFEELKYREIAEVLDVPMGTVKSRLFVGIENLMAEFERRFSTEKNSQSLGKTD